MTTPSLHRPIEILLVEDSPLDVRLTREALKEARVTNELHVAENGEDALAYLRDPNTALPDLVLLDLNLPGISGRDVLEQIKSDEALAHLPVVILTTSRSEQDILAAYKQHTNCYIIKPLDLDQFVEVVRQIRTFWFTVVALPTKEA